MIRPRSPVSLRDLLTIVSGVAVGLALARLSLLVGTLLVAGGIGRVVSGMLEV